MSQIYVLCPRIMSQVLEKFLELGSTSQKRSWVQPVGSRKGLRFRSIIPTFLSYVIVNLLDLGHRSRKCSQIQALCPKKGSRFSPRSQKRPRKVPRKGPRFRSQPRFMSQGLEKFLELGSTSQKRSWVQSVGSRKGLRFRSIIPTFLSYVLVNLLDLGHRSKKCSQIFLKKFQIQSQVLETSQIQGLVPRKGPRFRSYVLDLCPRYWKRSKNQVLRPRFAPRLRSYILGLCPTYWKMSKNQVLRPGFDPRFRS